MKKLTLIALVFTLFLGMASSSTSVGAQSANPADVIQAAYTAVADKDIDTAMSYVADDMVLTLIPPPPGMDGVFIGKEAVRAWWEGLTQVNGRAEFSDVIVSGNRATWRAKWYADNFEAMGVGPAEFEGVSVAQNGLLKSATWVFTEEFQARLAKANRLATNEILIQRYMEELWNQNDLTVAEELIAEDFVSHNFPAGDREALLESVVDFRAGTPNGYFTYDDMTITDDRVFIVTQLMIRPDGAAADATGAPASDPMVLIMGVKDGKISERTLFMAAPAEITPPPTE